MSLLNLGRVETEESNKSQMVIQSKKQVNMNYRPHKVFRNWTQGYRIPLICFIEVSMMILYVIFGVMHQRSSNNFTLDFGKAVDSYFLDDYGFDEAPENSNSAQGFIYFRDQFLDIILSTGNRLFSFSETLPFSHPFTCSKHFDMYVTTIGGGEMKLIFTEDNLSLISIVASAFIDDFAQISLIMEYHVDVIIGNQHRVISLAVTGEFTRDTDSDTIILDFFHTRIPGDSSDDYSIHNYSFSFAGFIALFGFLALLLTIYNIYEVFTFSLEKAERNFQKQLSVFWSKIDQWSFFSLVSHIMSVFSCIYYIFNGQKFTQAMPTSLILMSFSTFLHCLLLIRYLKQKPSTMIIVNVIFDAGVTLIQFLVGCMVIFAGYLILGCCIFGTFTFNFSTFTQGAIVLIAIIHGDSIQDIFDTVMVRADVPWWCGFIYMSVWVFFSLTIMFNISISIFEESLTREIYNVANKDDKNKQAGKIEAFSLSLPKSYRTIF